MNLNDDKLRHQVKNCIPVLIMGEEYTIKPNPKGSCDGCCFYEGTCPPKAVTICCSNGGNILVKAKQTAK